MHPLSAFMGNTRLDASVRRWQVRSAYVLLGGSLVIYTINATQSHSRFSQHKWLPNDPFARNQKLALKWLDNNLSDSIFRPGLFFGSILFEVQLESQKKLTFQWNLTCIRVYFQSFFLRKGWMQHCVRHSFLPSLSVWVVVHIYSSSG